MEHADKKVDRRVVKTKKAIRSAFAQLLTQKDVNEITIKDIADIADINRKTFYSHYSGIYQILDEIEDEIVSAVNDVIGEINWRRDLKDPYTILTKLTGVINSDIDFYGHLLRTENNTNLLLKIVAALKEKICASFSAQVNIEQETLDIVAEYMISGMLAVYRNWFNSDRQRSIEEVAGVVGVLIVSGMNGLLGGEA